MIKLRIWRSHLNRQLENDREASQAAETKSHQRDENSGIEVGEAETLGQRNSEDGRQGHGDLGSGHLRVVSPGKGAQDEGANQTSQNQETHGQARLTLLVTQRTHELL